MLEQKNVTELVTDLEQRINKIQQMNETELGTFNRIDWLVLILICLVIPVIAVVAAR